MQKDLEKVAPLVEERVCRSVPSWAVCSAVRSARSRVAARGEDGVEKRVGGKVDLARAVSRAVSSGHSAAATKAATKVRAWVVETVPWKEVAEDT